MRTQLISLTILTTLAFTSGLAAAEEPRTKPAETKPSDVVYAKKTVIDFTELTVTGELVRPDQSYIVVPRRARFRSLVRTRGDFRVELETSKDHL